VKEGSVVERVLLTDWHLHHPRERFGRICWEAAHKVHMSSSVC
jgi:hypothetical protein